MDGYLPAEVEKSGKPSLKRGDRVCFCGPKRWTIGVIQNCNSGDDKIPYQRHWYMFATSTASVLDNARTRAAAKWCGRQQQSNGSGGDSGRCNGTCYNGFTCKGAPPQCRNAHSSLRASCVCRSRRTERSARYRHPTAIVPPQQEQQRQ